MIKSPGRASPAANGASGALSGEKVDASRHECRVDHWRVIMSMPVKEKINSVVVLGVAVAFQWFFMFTKHDPGLRPVIPFGDDPYDALGSFATIVDIPLCLLLLWRAFRPYGVESPSPLQIQYLRRTQAAVPLLVLVTLAADAVAMVRHPHMWIGSSSRNELLALLGGMTVISGGALRSVLGFAPTRIDSQRRATMISSGIVAALFVLCLAVYPERLINRLSTHLVTVLIGDLLLFVPVSVLLRFLIPDAEASAGGQTKARRHSLYVWAGVTMAGLLIGVWLFVAEMTEGGSPMPALRFRVFVASVYIGLTIAGLLIAVAFLKRPLGLGQGNTVQSSR